MKVVNVITSNRGNPHLLTNDNYRFRKADKFSEATHWRCLDKKCRARIHTEKIDNNIIQTLGEHNHLSDYREVTKQIVSNVIKESARNSQKPPSELLADGLLQALV